MRQDIFSGADFAQDEQRVADVLFSLIGSSISIQKSKVSTISKLGTWAKTLRSWGRVYDRKIISFCTRIGF